MQSYSDFKRTDDERKYTFVESNEHAHNQRVA